MGDGAEKEVVEGSQADPEAKYVSLTKYVGVKEMLGKRETRIGELETEMKNLAEQLKAKSEVDPEEFKRMVAELEQKKDLTVEKFNQITAELEQRKTQELDALKTQLTQVGFTEEELKDKNSAELTLLMKGAVKGKGQAKPGADLGAGSGVSSAFSAREKMQQGFEQLHPSK